ncbi:MAG: hypothetical protein H3C68_07610 [Deltaproteobacteria bacterium]|nr:hypothetical protein [Deltaproteobacteria bacterium]MBZ0220585.1 hypothetical protein [Deltaproteobacteria bacterium]
MAGKRNIAFGFLYLLLTIVLYLASRPAETGEAFESALVQANIDALLNIGAGWLITRLPFVEWVANTVSYLMIAGALLRSGTLCLAAMGLLPPAAAIMPVGALILIAMMLFMGIGYLSLKVVRQ